jgi:PIN domain nuclease of toxin-antitoxin system
MGSDGRQARQSQAGRLEGQDQDWAWSSSSPCRQNSWKPWQQLPVRYLLHAHTLIWWMTADPHLSKSARLLIQHKENLSPVSAAPAWEIATKVCLGRLPAAADLVQNFVTDWRGSGSRFSLSPQAWNPGRPASRSPQKDPFVRMLIALALAENVLIVSNDRALDGCGVRRLWSQLPPSRLLSAARCAETPLAVNPRCFCALR